MIERLNRLEAYFIKFPFLESLATVSALILIMVLTHYIVKFAFFRIVGVFAKKIPFIIREVIHEKELFRKLSLFAPLVVFYIGIAFVPGVSATLITLLQKLSVIGLILIGLNVINFVFSELNDAYTRYDIARSRPIKGYLQVISILLYLLGFIFCISTLLDRSPLVFLSGLGALTAVLLLVFRDTLLSLVAGVQLTTNNLIRVGDWIEMPQFSADGDVIDIALHTVKVQN